MSGLTRRQLLIGGTAGTLALSAPRFTISSVRSRAHAAPVPELPAYTTWEDVYRRAWSWDRVVRGTHQHQPMIGQLTA